MDKIIEALSKLLSEDQSKEVAGAVEQMFAEAKGSLEAEYNKKLEEAYQELTQEVKDAEAIAEKGYQEAYNMIASLKHLLETQKVEFEKALEEGYEEAFQMLQAERGQKEKLESALYEEYDKKLADMKEYMIDKIDQFLQHKGKDIYEQARRDIMNDPNMVEHKLTLNKIVETVADYISDEDYAVAVSTKIEESAKQLEEMQGKVRLLEARNIRLSSENTKLTESVRQSETLIKEHTAVAAKEEKNARTTKASNVTGSGQKVMDGIKVIGEHTEPAAKTTDDHKPIVEGVNNDMMSQWRVLSGVPATK